MYGGWPGTWCIMRGAWFMGGIPCSRQKHTMRPPAEQRQEQRASWVSQRTSRAGLPASSHPSPTAPCSNLTGEPRGGAPPAPTHRGQPQPTQA